jgi:large subunit ribosomal protein L15
MNLNELNDKSMPYSERSRKGRGRSAGQGKTCGRGTKGQQSRSGYSRKLGHEGGQMPLYRRLPKRGFSNFKFRKDFVTLNIEDLETFEAGSVVDLDVVKAKGLVPRSSLRLKILGQGALTTKLVVRAHAYSERARAAITDAGGQAEEVA